MNWDEVLEAFRTMRIWTQNGQRAPHKPLLVLFALGRWAAYERQPIPFATVDKRLGELLREFGPPRPEDRTQDPFWRLRGDVWELAGTERLPVPAGADPPGRSQLRDAGVTGAFSRPVQEAFRREPALVSAVARMLLERHFPESIHAEILAAVGLDLTCDPPAGQVADPRRRNPDFRRQVLLAYRDRCAVCRVSVRLNRVPIGLDAAHIRWFQCDGPDEVRNGLALCSLHHKAFDLGAFTITPGLVILVSDLVSGEGDHEVLLRHHERATQPPAHREDNPGAEFLEWHRSEVFKGTPIG